MTTITKTRGATAQEIRATIFLALPLVVGQLAAIGQNVVDIMLAGHLGAHVLGAVAVGTNLWTLAIMAMLGVMLALSPSIAQLDGAGRRGEVGPLFRQAVWLALAVGLLMQAAVYWVAPEAVRLIGVDPALAADTAHFLHSVSFAAPALSVYLACRGLAEGLSMPRPAMVFSVVGLILLGPVGYVLMYPLGLGAFGSGVAVSVLCWAQLAGFAAYLRASRHFRGLGWEQGRFWPEWGPIAGLLKISLPMAFSLLMEAGMFAMAALAVGRFGDVEVASHQIALNVSSVTFMVPLGLAMAITVRVGNAVGRGDPAGIRRAGLVGAGLALCSQAVACVLMLAMPAAIAGLYTRDPAVLSGAVGLLFLAALFQLSDGLQVASNGALRGLKDARMPMLITAFSYWCVGMPLGWFMAFPMGWRTPGMWVGLIGGLSTAAALLSGRFLVLSARRPGQEAMGRSPRLAGL